MTLPLAASGQSNYATPDTFATLAGGQSGDANGTGSGAEFFFPHGEVVDGAGNIYVADSGNKAIRKVTPTGAVTTLVTGGVLVSPYGLALDNAKNFYVADYGAGAILKVTQVGTEWKSSILASGFGAPYGVAVDGATNLYVADSGASLIQKLAQVGTNWVVTTIAGPAGFDHPCGVAVDRATNIYVAGGSNNIIYRISPVGTNWIVTTLAGMAGVAGTNDGMGAKAQFDFPTGVAVDAATNLYIADQSNSTIRKVTPLGTNWVVTTLAGSADTSGTNDGTGSAAQFYFPGGVAIDAAGDLYVADSQNNRIRRGFPALGAPVILTCGTGLVFSNGLFGFNLAGTAGQPVEVDVSSDLMSWLGFWTNICGPGVLSFSDAQSANYPKRFYRAHVAYPRRPIGVYAKVVVSDVIKANTNADWNSYFDCLYGNLLSNTAISGLALQVNWDSVNTAPNVYDWHYLTNAFNQVSNWNSLNPQTPKTIQFIVTAGFNSPQWVLTDIESTNGSCDGMFSGPGCADCTNCGTVTFFGYDENADGNVLPLPWNQIYKTAWSNFLFEVNEQFGDNPALVSISVAGPTASSDEMILPNDTNTCQCQNDDNPCNICPGGTNAEPQPNGLMPSQMWNDLLANHYGPSYTNSNQALVEEWERAIDLYEGIFRNLTLVLTPANGEGFPFDPATPTTDPLCQYSTNSSCTAVADILTYFENYRSVNRNGKASQVSGLKSNILTLENSDANIGGVKYLSAQWQTANPWDQILGGAQFNHSFSSGVPTNDAAKPEQDEFSILANFFNGTLAINGTSTFPGLFTNVSGENTVNSPLTNPAPLNYLQVYYQDVLYAESNGCVLVTNGVRGQVISVSAQDLLNAANQLLLTIGELPYPPSAIPAHPPVCSPSPPPPCEPP
jgi:sugar lactone lactonase YvrE